MSDFIPCVPKMLPEDIQVAAAETAVKMNATNAPRVHAAQAVVSTLLASVDIEPPILTPEHLAVLTGKMWPNGGVRLTVGFMEPCPVDLRDRILSFANVWSKYANISFAWTQTDPQIRISRETEGYWSYLGTDILHIPKNQPTMSLQGFTMQTSDSECKRVIEHEFGHTCGWPHEQFLPEILELLDFDKVIPWAMAFTGWSRQMVIDQMLTPLQPSSYRMTAHADVNGIMMYPFPASVTKNGVAIPGGTEIDAIDGAFASTVYPLLVQPPPPQPTATTHTIVVKGGTITVDGKAV